MRVAALVFFCVALWPLWLVAPAPAAAEVYKWVDEKGVTHYGEKPPPNHKSRQVIIRDSGPRQGVAPDDAAATLKDKDIQFRQRQTLREQEEVKVAQEKAARDRWCRAARMQLGDLKTMRRIYDLDDKGERVYKSDAERDAELASREAELNQRCR